MSEFIEFTVNDTGRFLVLQKVFYEIKHDKDAEDWRSSDELLQLFDAESLSHFYWPDKDERLQRLENLRTRPTIIAATEDATGATWDFDSLIDALVNGEYELKSCEMVAPTHARLNFYALAYPYGGVGCMVALIEAFDFTVTGIEDGTGFVSFMGPT